LERFVGLPDVFVALTVATESQRTRSGSHINMLMSPFSALAEILASSKPASPQDSPAQLIVILSQISPAYAKTQHSPFRSRDASPVSAIAQRYHVSRDEVFPVASSTLLSCRLMSKPSEINDLSTALCAPVGGLAPSVSASLLTYVATATKTLALTSGSTSTSMSVTSSATAFTVASNDPTDVQSYPACGVSRSRKPSAMRVKT